MARKFNILAALLLTTGFGLVAAETAVAQLKEGCGVEISEADRAAMQGSEEGAGAPAPHRGDPDMTGPEEHAAMEGSVEGSGAPMPGRGECDDIDKLPQADNTEG
jgi:hypothetical protein